MQQATKRTQRQQGEPLPEPYRRRLLELIDREGEQAVLGLLEVGRQTLARCAAGLRVRRATVTAVTYRLQQNQ
jgi:hypothetical protein